MNPQTIGTALRISLACGLLLAFGTDKVRSADQDSFVAWADKEITQLREEHNLASVTGAVSVDGEIVWQGATGYADIDSKRLATSDTPYRIASLTKSMTGVAVIKLAASKKVDLSATVQTYVPQFPTKEWPVTIEHLLYHTSGMAHYKGWENRPTTHYPTLNDAIKVFQDRPLRFKPGSKYSYTTYGYTLLGAAIEGATGTDYEAWMDANIWQPAGMNATQLEHRDKPIEGQAKLYRLKRRELVPDLQTDLSVKGPGGGVVSTASDLVRFADAVMSGKLLDHQSRKQLWTTPEPHNGPPYAAGWIVDPNHELGYVASNDGNQSGANSRLILLPERNTAVALLCNVSRVGKPMQNVALSLLRKVSAEE